MHKPEPVLENETHKIFWDFEIKKVPPNVGQKTWSSDKKMRSRNIPQRIGKWTGRFGNKKISGDHPDYSIIKISQNTEKSPGDLKRLAVTQTPVRNHQLTLVWKTLKWVKLLLLLLWLLLSVLSVLLSARGVMVIVEGNGHGDASSNPGRDWLHFTLH